MYILYVYIVRICIQRILTILYILFPICFSFCLFTFLSRYHRPRHLSPIETQHLACQVNSRVNRHTTHHYRKSLRTAERIDLKSLPKRTLTVNRGSLCQVSVKNYIPQTQMEFDGIYIYFYRAFEEKQIPTKGIPRALGHCTTNVPLVFSIDSTLTEFMLHIV